MGRLAGKVAIITGANRGIGRALAEGFAAEGARILAVGRDRAGVEMVAGAIRASGGVCQAFQLDVMQAERATEMARAAVEAFGRVDVMVSNAGVISRLSVLEVTESEWDRVLDTNLRGAFFCAQAAGRIMVQQGSGSIIFLSSQLVAAPRPNAAPYTASKAGLIGLTKAMALELGAFDVRVNALMPGVIETDQNRDRLAKPGQREFDLQRMILKRLGQPRDVLGASVFLASDESAFMTGATLRVDGGWLG